MSLQLREQGEYSWAMVSGSDASGTVYLWQCTGPDNYFKSYRCDQDGWISQETPPDVVGTKCLVFENGEDVTGDEWYQCPEYEDFSWLYADFKVTHWQPRPNLPGGGS